MAFDYQNIMNQWKTGKGNEINIILNTIKNTDKLLVPKSKLVENSIIDNKGNVVTGWRLGAFVKDYIKSELFDLFIEPLMKYNTVSDLSLYMLALIIKVFCEELDNANSFEIKIYDNVKGFCKTQEMEMYIKYDIIIERISEGISTEKLFNWLNPNRTIKSTFMDIIDIDFDDINGGKYLVDNVKGDAKDDVKSFKGKDKEASREVAIRRAKFLERRHKLSKLSIIGVVKKATDNFMPGGYHILMGRQTFRARINNGETKFRVILVDSTSSLKKGLYGKYKSRSKYAAKLDDDDDDYKPNADDFESDDGIDLDIQLDI
jgi:hypothetical protein